MEGAKSVEYFFKCVDSKGYLYPFLAVLLLNLVKTQIPTGSTSDTIIPFIWFCVAAIGFAFFGA